MARHQPITTRSRRKSRLKFQTQSRRKPGPTDQEVQGLKGGSRLSPGLRFVGFYFAPFVSSWLNRRHQTKGGAVMARIRHIALTTKEPAKVAEFYKSAFGL